MIHSETKNEKTFIELKVKPASVFLKAVLIFFAVIPHVLLISAIALSDKVESPFGFFLAFIFFGVFSFFFFRMVLWNTYGKELYTMNNTEFTSINDYGWFKDNPKSVAPFSKLEMFFFAVEKPNVLYDFTDDTLNKVNKKAEYCIVFMVDDIPFPSVVKQTAKNLTGFIQEAEKFNNAYAGELTIIPTEKP